MAKADVESGKACAILAYLLIGVIWYFADDAMRKNSFAKYHTKQALVLIITGIITNIILSLIIVIGWILLPLFEAAFIILMIIGIINAVNGKEKKLPIIGGFSDKFTF